MKPVFQTTFGEGEGNCFQASVASIFETELDDIPHFCKLYDAVSWYDEFRKFCIEKFGVYPLCIEANEQNKRLLAGYHLASVMTTRNILHSVVCLNGEVVHDPYPGGSEITKVETYDIFCSMMGYSPNG